MAIGGFVASLGARASLDRLTGMGRRLPLTATAFLICSLSLAGLPLTAGFISKLYLVRAILEAESYVILAIVLMSSALSVVYLWKIVEVMWVRPAPIDDLDIKENPALFIPLWIIAGANIWLGLDASLLVTGAEAAAKALLGPATFLGAS